MFFIFGATLPVAAQSPAQNPAQSPARQPPPPRHGAFPRVSPDGKQVLFVRDSAGQALPYLMDADGSNERRAVAQGSWYPDGKRMLALVGRTRTNPGQLMIVNLDGTGMTEVPMLGPLNGLVVLSASVLGGGTRLLLSMGSRDSTGRVRQEGTYMVRHDGTEATRIQMPKLDGRMLGLVANSDLRMLAFAVADTTNPETPFDSTTIYVMNIDGSGLRKVATLPDGIEQLSWSRDGKRLAAQRDERSPRNRATLPPGHVDDANIVVLDIASGKWTQITHHTRPYLDETPSWAPDDHLYIQSNRDGRMEVYRMKADGSDQQRITK